VSAHDPDSLAWYARTQLPLFAWSAQAAGYFAGVVVERVYESEANRERRRRATELAARLGAKPTQVALAWTLGQPFPTHAVIGPRSVAELRESVEALELELTPQDVRWLDLGDEDG
jgi:aryl-alcohol dehydrogenase-like predicted oxidoreductase